jgi:outer membrane biosynthesis protein TonB
MRKYLAAAFFAAIPFGFFLANGLPEASAREGGFLGNLFSKRKAKECETPCVEPAKTTPVKTQEPKKETPKPEVKPEPKKETPKPEVKPEPKKETPKPEVKPEPKKETPKPEVKPEPKKEAPKTEVKKEAPKSEPKKEVAKADPKKETPKDEPKKTASASSSTPPAGFVNLFNGKDFSNWWGFGTSDPRKFKALPPAEQAKIKEANMKDILAHWKVEGNEIVNDGKGLYLTTEKEFADYELHLEYKMLPKGDSGIYLKYTPQVQIWDYTDKDKFKIGADKGSGGLWNNSAGAPGKDPLVLADKPFGEWNKFRIIQVGARTTVYLNDKLVVDNAILENYFDRKMPLLQKGAIQLQTHGSEIRWKNIFIKELSPEEANKHLASKANSGFESIFDGKTLKGWTGSVDNYEVVDDSIQCKKGKGGVLYTDKKYSDFVVRLEFMVPPGGNNGLAIRYPGGNKDAAYIGMTELQVLDSEDARYAKLDPRQYHGSSYGMAPAHRGYLRAPNTWNYQEVTVKGSTIKVELNGNIILDTDLSKITEYMAKSPHPGKDLKEGHFGFAGHSDPVRFRNLQIKPIAAK